MKLIVFGALPAPYNRGGCGEPPLIQAASTIKKIIVVNPDPLTMVTKKQCARDKACLHCFQHIRSL
jgi:hypothetical protein